MEKILLLFLIGISVGILVPLGEKMSQAAELINDPLTVIEQIFASGSRLWHFGISILVLITLPTVIFKSIRNRLSKKKFLPIPFMTGMSFGFTFMSALGLVVSVLK